MSQDQHAPHIQVGDTVAFRWQVAQSRGWCAPDLLGARGKVIGLVPLPSTVLLHVAWDRTGLPQMLSPQELCRVLPDRPVGKAPGAMPPSKSDG